MLMFIQQKTKVHVTWFSAKVRRHSLHKRSKSKFRCNESETRKSHKEKLHENRLKMSEDKNGTKLTQNGFFVSS